jgi:hypothetical protein
LSKGSSSSTDTHIGLLIPCRLRPFRDPDRAGDHPGYDLTKLVPLDVNDAALSSTDDHGNDVAVGELEAAEGLRRLRLRDVVRPLTAMASPSVNRHSDLKRAQLDIVSTQPTADPGLRHRVVPAVLKRDNYRAGDLVGCLKGIDSRRASSQAARSAITTRRALVRTDRDQRL